MAYFAMTFILIATLGIINLLDNPSWLIKEETMLYPS